MRDARVVQNFGKLHFLVSEYNLLLFTKGKVRSGEYSFVESGNYSSVSTEPEPHICSCFR